MLLDPLEVSPRQAADTLGDLARLRRRTRRSLGVPWFPMVCFGALTMLSAPVVAAAGTVGLAPFWLVTGPVGMLLTRRHYRRRARHRGVSGRGRRAWIVAGAMFAGCMAAGLAAGLSTGAAAGVLAPIVVVVAGYIVLGWMARDPVPSLAIAPGAVLAGAGAAAGLAPWIIELSFGAGLLVAGVALRATRARS